MNSLQDWASLATIVAGVGTFTAAVVAVVAVIQARSIQNATSKPYLVAFTERVSPATLAYDVVIKNLGATAAHNIEIQSTPTMQRSPWRDELDETEPQDVPLIPKIPVLAPGQEWRTVWDVRDQRRHSGLPHRYELTLKYGGVKGKRSVDTYVLDWRTIYAEGVLSREPQDEIADELKVIRMLLQKTWKTPFRVSVNGQPDDHTQP